MSTIKLSGEGSRRTRRHTWTLDQKRCLLILFQLDLTAIEIATVFHDLFQTEIDPDEFPQGLPYKSLRAQHREHKREENVSWSKIMLPESPGYEMTRRQQLTQRIEQSLQRSCGQVDVASDETATTQIPDRAASRKRKADALGDDFGGLTESDAHPTPSTRQRKLGRRAEMVLIIRSEASTVRLSDYEVVDETPPAPTPVTPKKQVKQVASGLLTPPTTVRIFRCTGPPLDVSEDVHAEIEAGYIPPSEQEAHPPLGGIFYRFWDAEHSHGQNSVRGFVAQRYVRSNAIPVRTYAPPAMHLDPTDRWNHLNEEPEATPFVSVSDSLVWSLSKVLKLVKGSKWKNARLAVISAKALSPPTVFHAAGFYRQLKKIRPFTNGAHRGVSSHEFLIWRDI